MKSTVILLILLTLFHLTSYPKITRNRVCRKLRKHALVKVH